MRTLIYIPLLTAVLLGGLPQAQVTGGKHRGSDNTGQLHRDQREKPGNSPVFVVQQQVINCNPRDQQSKAETSSSANRAHDWVDWLNASSTAVIAAFTILMFLAVMRQIGTSRDTERAWVIASPVDNAPALGFIPDAGSNLQAHLMGANKRNAFTCSFKSTGNTPARIVEIAIRYRYVATLADIPPEPDYGNRTPLNDLPLVKEESVGFITFLEPNAILPKASTDAVERQQAFLYAYGIVVYRDVYNRVHETRFGYIYHFPQGGDPRERGFRKEMLPPAYNEAT